MVFTSIRLNGDVTHDLAGNFDTARNSLQLTTHIPDICSYLSYLPAVVRLYLHAKISRKSIARESASCGRRVACRKKTDLTKLRAWGGKRNTHTRRIDSAVWRFMMDFCWKLGVSDDSLLAVVTGPESSIGAFDLFVHSRAKRLSSRGYTRSRAVTAIYLSYFDRRIADGVLMTRSSDRGE